MTVKELLRHMELKSDCDVVLSRDSKVLEQYTAEECRLIRDVPFPTYENKVVKTYLIENSRFIIKI